LIGVGIGGGLLIYPVLQASALRKMHGGWRALAALPLLPMAVVLSATVIGLVQGSNLWPLLLIFTAPVALIYLFILRFVHARRATGGTRPQA